MNNVTDIQSEKDKMEWNKTFKHFELDEIVITFTERSVARVYCSIKKGPSMTSLEHNCS